MLNALYLLNREAIPLIYGPAEQADIAARINLIAPPLDAAALTTDPAPLAHADVIFSGWGMPPVTAELLAAAPRLRAIFYGAGSIRGFATEAMWQRGILVSSAWSMNAIPVAEFTLAQILLALKSTWRFARTLSETRRWNGHAIPVAGAYGSVVGLLALGQIGRRVARLLAGFDLTVIAHDPYAPPELAAELGLTLVSLEELFARAQVLSIHTPWLPATEGLVTGSLIESMPPDATLINTARGAVIRETEMLEILARRPDLTAILDVTWPEPPAADSPLWTLPNVVLTPHIAGSLGAECRRMGRAMIDEFDRFAAGQPLQWQVTRELLERMG